ncbi:NAD-P-binding protein [Trametes meyenii]|nr:NAD-P-binding protein [Trametes meyenii]
MSNDSRKSLVLVIGATGTTGRSIIKGLIATKTFRVAALVRPASSTKSATEELRASGVEIRLGDVTDGEDKLREVLAGVDIIVSGVVAWVLQAQKDVFRAAKAVGVKRVVPCDFATPGERGVRVLHDEKLDIRDYVKELGIGYTFIDVGWWMQLLLPLPERSTVLWKQKTYEIHHTGTQKVLVTDHRHIGTYVARIIADPRTLNQAVVIWEDEVAQLQAHEIGERRGGLPEGEEECVLTRAGYEQIPAEEVLKRLEAAKAEVRHNPDDVAAQTLVAWNGYLHSMFFLGENTLENAKRLGYLDARELYPDVPKHTFEEFAKEYYTLEEPGKLEYSKE